MHNPDIKHVYMLTVFIQKRLMRREMLYGKREKRNIMVVDGN